MEYIIKIYLSNGKVVSIVVDGDNIEEVKRQIDMTLMEDGPSVITLAPLSGDGPIVKAKTEKIEAIIIKRKG